LVGEIVAGKPSTIDVAVFPPFPYIAALADSHIGSGLGFGAQDVSEHEGQGAYTGEVSAAMLANCGAQWVLVGHSERRQYHGESDELVARKFAAARAGGLTPILCVGETLAQREAGETEAVISRQLQAVIALNGIGSFDTAVIAYEPVWAIGTGISAAPDTAQQAHAIIRGLAGGAATLLYGGSVTPANAAALLSMPDIDGALVGGASLNADDFLAITLCSPRR
jgi:triosephosphate isomerase